MTFIARNLNLTESETHERLCVDLWNGDAPIASTLLRLRTFKGLVENATILELDDLKCADQIWII